MVMYLVKENKMTIIIISGKKGKKIKVFIQQQNGMIGSNLEDEVTPQQLINLIDEYNDEEELIVSNEPLVLEISNYSIRTRDSFKRLRLNLANEILESWS